MSRPWVLLALLPALWPAVASPQSYGPQAIAAGSAHFCVLMSHGRAVCLGANDRGQLGDGATQSRAWPAGVVGDGRCEMSASDCGVSTSGGCLTELAAIATGGRHTCALAESGEAWCWGANDAGQLGVGDTDDRALAARVVDLPPVTALALGRAHTCARDSAGAVYCWGDNHQGQLGVAGAGDGSTRPLRLEDATGSAEVVAAADYTCSRRSAGVTCWGETVWPAVPSGLDRAEALAAGDRHLCARLADGSVACLGANDHGQLGDGGSEPHSEPVAVRGLATAHALAAGVGTSCAVYGPDRFEARLSCWGANDRGQLASGSTGDRASPGPALVAFLLDRSWDRTRLETPLPAESVAQVALGAGFGCLLPRARWPLCWGRIDDAPSGLDYDFGLAAVPYSQAAAAP